MPPVGHTKRPYGHKPTLPFPPSEPFRLHGTLVPRPGLDLERIPELMTMVPTADVATLQRHHITPGENNSHIVLRAIDPATGDSLLHRAAAAGNVTAMDALRQFGRGIQGEQLSWVFITHENNAGETALHAAARAGNKMGAAAVYRAFHRMDLGGDLEDPDDPVGWVWESQEGGFPNHEPPLAFVCTRNKQGRDAAAVAREAGFEDLALWFENLAGRLDINRQRHDEEAMRQIKRRVPNDYWYVV